MKKIFKIENGDIVDPIQHTIDILKQNKDVKIYVGTDSQNKKKFTCYVTCICYKYGHRGAHYIYVKENVKKIKDRYLRLWGEVERSVEVAQLLETNNIKVGQIDLDFNKKEIARSSTMVNAAKGYVIGMGYAPEQVTVKPEDGQIATRSADHLCRL